VRGTCFCHWSLKLDANQLPFWWPLAILLVVFSLSHFLCRYIHTYVKNLGPQYLKVVFWLMCLALEVMFYGRDIPLVGAVFFLVIIVATGINYDPLGASLLLLLATLGAFLSAFAGGSRWCHLAAVGCHFPIAYEENGPDRLLARGMPGSNI
jgi:hypothetical protein